MKKYNITFLFIIMISLSGCKNFNRKSNNIIIPDLYNSISEIDQSNNDIKKSILDINKANNNITKYTSNIDDTINSIEDIKDSKILLIQNNTNSIKDSNIKLLLVNENLSNVRNNLTKTKQNLKEEQIKVENRTKEIDSLNSKVDKSKDIINNLKNKNNQILKAKLNWIILSSTIGVGICFALAIFLRSKLALMGAFTLAAILGVSVVVSMYLQWIAYATIVFGIGAGIWLAWKGYHQTKAVEDLIKTGELVKESIDENTKNEIFGKGEEKGKAGKVQCKATQKIVHKTRKKINNKSNGKKVKFKLPFFRK